ncbi:hypothetical protein HOE22_10855 [Candidatus Woesearchaeota archaeon]|jgi:hypothetical protein|nr:hypothetical protein [Candidatus Woesearchaeota archaeon]MBT4732541.1 hypothetical protein [Candidatus Woesearchaeota archaeon]MBT7558762.1 hypothetical protein [Candidatus Woesearchaeota archaeon]
MWKRFTGEQVTDIETTLLTDIASIQDEHNLSFYIGGDSMKRCDTTTYTVVLVMLMEGKGGRGYYKNIKIKDVNISMQQRLFKETYEAVETALFINPILESIGYNIKEIHTDINPKSKYASSEMVKQVIGYCMGMGFEGVLKPNSWAAMECADKFSK